MRFLRGMLQLYATLLGIDDLVDRARARIHPQD